MTKLTLPRGVTRTTQLKYLNGYQISCFSWAAYSVRPRSRRPTSSADQSGAEPLRGRGTLAAIVRALKRKYHWTIETASFPSNAADGRATRATVYRLTSEVINAVMDDSGHDSLKSGRIARADALGPFLAR